MEIHNRDVMERMVKANCNSVSDFEWLSQLRFVFLRDSGEFGKCEVRQTNSVLEYSYEYQGNNGRLVVTPLTDRCVLTLITAMYLNRGGNPLGPAGQTTHFLTPHFPLPCTPPHTSPLPYSYPYRYSSSQTDKTKPISRPTLATHIPIYASSS